MGAWGYHLLANDRSLDLVGELANKQVEVLSKMFADEKVCAFGRLGALSAAIETDSSLSWSTKYSLQKTDILQHAINDIDYLLECEDWISGWSEPKKLKSTLTRFKKKLNKVIKEFGEER